MCIPNPILPIRKSACDVLLNGFVHPTLKSPIWCAATFGIVKSQIDKEREICNSNCLPIAMATYGLMINSNCNSDCKYRVVIGEVIQLNQQPSLNSEVLKGLHGLSGSNGFDGVPWHSWVEVSQDNFKTVSIIDLVYGFTRELPNSDNFDEAVAKVNKKKHIRMLTQGNDVTAFYKRLHLTSNWAPKMHDNHMVLARKYIQPY
ncbi:hypothetical protein [Vibrio parahaemolyticus]|uniref:hypothetical protein n=1 Tax=Vibrio parahaemolyticus TaxID=670 RepID=UPI001120F900|nr:hypothetical protein [Vibrio parahaemolyticus]TOI38803.1 hypothetical protein CGI60_23970 [Vibrio parahaemolyticus]